MAEHSLKNLELEVKRILDGPTRVLTAYGDIVIPVGHFIATLKDGITAFAFPPEAAEHVLDLTDDQRAELGLDDEPATTKMLPTAVGEAVVGVAGDYPAHRPDTLPQMPAAGVGPGATSPVGEAPADAPMGRNAAGEFVYPPQPDAEAAAADVEPTTDDQPASLAEAARQQGAEPVAFPAPTEPGLGEPQLHPDDQAPVQDAGA